MEFPLHLPAASEGHGTPGRGLFGPLDGELAKRYRITGQLAKGGENVVYRAVDVVSRESVVIKRMATLDGSAARFFHELHTLLRLRNEALVRLIDLGQAEDGTGFLVLEDCAGGSLRDLIGSLRSGQVEMTLTEKADLLAEIARAVAALHEAGHVHADVKPENILFSISGTEGRRPKGLKLADFGLAVAREAHRSEGQPLSGTPAYMAPERFRGDLGRASDLFAIGVIAYELVVGTLPFTGSPAQIVKAQRRGFERPDSKVPGAWSELIELLLELDQGWRLDDARVLEQLAMELQATDGPVQQAAPNEEWSLAPKGCLGILHLPTFSAPVFATRAGLFTSDGDRLPLAEDVKIDAVRQFRDGPTWIAASGDIYTTTDGVGFVRVAEGVGEALELHESVGSGGEVRALVLTRTHLTAYSQSGRSLWRSAIGAGGPTPIVMPLPDGAVGIADGSLAPKVTILDGAGRSTAAYQQRGIVWHGALSGDFNLDLELVTQSGVRAMTIDLSTRMQTAMPRSRGSLASIENDHHGRITIRRDGAIHCQSRALPTRFALEAEDRLVGVYEDQGTLHLTIERQGRILFAWISLDTLPPKGSRP